MSVVPGSSSESSASSAASASPDRGQLLELAVQAAEAAGRLVVERLSGGVTGVESKSTPTDLVSDVDRASESLIRDILGSARPDDGFLGEEGGAATGSSTVRWVVDPLDGTVNYLYRFPAWSVSVAAEIDGVVVAGAVHDPQRGETFCASTGGGAEMRTSAGRAERLAVNPVTELAAALIGTGFAYDADVRRRQGRIVAGVLPVVRDIRRAGSAALDLCWVGAGRLDGYYEAGTRHWDRAAGVLVAVEAGAWAGDLTGGPASDTMAMVAAPAIAPALVDLISRLAREEGTDR